ncbi:MAG: hypothetical protein JSR47_14850 [Proteobacteria bacterium]|nr:hypothetical protein [Pseudomonadota bacterium]MBS0546916.1 hypothetical protein [Pseudomonadota bacterium]
MLTLRYERRHKVLAVTFTGVMSSEELAEHDRLLLHFLAGRDGVRGLYDLTAVEALAVPVSRINQRGQRPSMFHDLRVVVAPGGAGLTFTRTISDQFRAAGHSEPVLVDTMAQAYALLGLVDPQFEAVDPPID